MDDIDRRIIALLRENARRSFNDKIRIPLETRASRRIEIVQNVLVSYEVQFSTITDCIEIEPYDFQLWFFKEQ